MPSNAHENLGRRMKDIDQLMQAHSALTQFQRARATAQAAGGTLERVSEVVDSLVNPPGVGRRHEVAALNRAAIVLLSAHLQGYVEDLFAEAADELLRNKVRSLEALVKQGVSQFTNPHAFRIERLFAAIGLPAVLNGISWQRATSRSVRQRLTDYVKLRNAIAHGTQQVVRKAKVIQFKRFVEAFGSRFEARVGSDVRAITGRAPW